MEEKILLRDPDVTQEELKEARQVVQVFADFFDTLREGVVHPDWHHDWPTRDYILKNFTLHSKSYARRMGSRQALDVAGGTVQVNYKIHVGGRAPSYRRAAEPLRIYTRNSTHAATNAINERWQELKSLAREKPFEAVRDNHRTVLSINPFIPRNLESRSRYENVTVGGRIFPKNYLQGLEPGLPPFSSSLKLGNGTKAVLTQLNVRQRLMDEDENRQAEDTRFDGSPESPGMVYVLLTLPNPNPDEPDLQYLLRIRNYQYIDQQGIAVATSWDPSKSKSELEPDEHRVDITVIPGDPLAPSSPRRLSASVTPTSSATQPPPAASFNRRVHRALLPRPPVSIEPPRPQSSQTTGYQWVNQTPGLIARYKLNNHSPRHPYSYHHTRQVQPRFENQHLGESSRSAQGPPEGQQALPSFSDFVNSLHRTNSPPNPFTRRYSLSVRQQGIYRQLFAGQAQALL